MSFYFLCVILATSVNEISNEGYKVDTDDGVRLALIALILLDISTVSTSSRCETIF
jgi:hypothetical protein